MEEKERNIYDRAKSAIHAFIFREPGALAQTAYDRQWRKKEVDDRSFQMYREAAETGQPFACFSVGRCYEEGRVVEKDLQKAYEWYQKGASGGDINAWVALGRMFDLGIYVDKDPKLSHMWLERAAGKGHPLGMIGSGKHYASGEGVPKDPKRALELFEQAHELNKGLASYVLGEAIGDGIGCEKDYKKAFELFKEADQNGYALGTFNVGMMLEMGLGCDQNKEQGFEYITKAADMGVPEALYRLAFDYRDGSDIVKQDKKKSFELFLKAADKGYISACLEVGLMYENGDGCEKDPKKAFHYYEIAANAGLHTAVVCLAVCYRSGIGCDPDPVKARDLLELGVKMGNTRAYHLLALTLFEEDPYDERAVNLEMVASRGGFNRSSMKMASFFLQDGETGPDKGKAEFYYRQAASQGDTFAAFELAELLNTEENRGDEKVQKEIRRLYRYSADAHHPLAAYQLAKEYLSPKEETHSLETSDSENIVSGMHEVSEKDEERYVHYMSIAATGGIPDAAVEVAGRHFWGAGMSVNIPVASALFKYAADELESEELSAKAAITRIITRYETKYWNIGNTYPNKQTKGELKMPLDPKNKEEAMTCLEQLSTLAEKGVETARIYLPLAKILVFDSRLSDPEDTTLLSAIDTLPETKEKFFFQGLIHACLHKEDIPESIRLFSRAKELGASNVTVFIGNLYRSLAYSGRKIRKESQTVLLGKAKDLYLEAYRNQEVKTPLLFYSCVEEESERSIRKMLGMIYICSALAVPLIWLLDIWEERTQLSGSQMLERLEYVIAWVLLFTIIATLIVEVIYQVSKIKQKKKMKELLEKK